MNQRTIPAERNDGVVASTTINLQAIEAALFVGDVVREDRHKEVIPQPAIHLASPRVNEMVVTSATLQDAKLTPHLEIAVFIADNFGQRISDIDIREFDLDAGEVLADCGLQRVERVIEPRKQFPIGIRLSILSH